MAQGKVRWSLREVVKQASIEKIQRSESDRVKTRPKSLKRWSSSSGVIYRITKAIHSFRKSDDQILQVVRLECSFPNRSSFLVVVCNDAVKEYCLIGVDCIDFKDLSDKLVASNDALNNIGMEKEPTETIGLVIKLLPDTVPRFDGDGGFKIKYCGRSYLFKPVSLQALWKIIQTLHMISERLTPSSSRSPPIRPSSLDVIQEDMIREIQKFNWVKEYEDKINSPQYCINVWERFEDILSKRPNSPVGGRKSLSSKLYDGQDFETAIKTKLRRIMRHVDLDRITSRVIRKQLETEMGEKLDKYRTFIDEEILLALGQMDQSSKILEYLYLGSEWNASNFDELKENKITHVLNVTREIDNFYPGSFKYKNIRVWDLGNIQKYYTSEAPVSV